MENGKFRCHLTCEEQLGHADAYIRALQRKVGENEAYIQELETDLAKARAEARTLAARIEQMRGDKQEWCRETVREEQYKRLAVQMSEQGKELQSYRRKVADLAATIYRQQLKIDIYEEREKAGHTGASGGVD